MKKSYRIIINNCFIKDKHLFINGIITIFIICSIFLIEGYIRVYTNQKYDFIRSDSLIYEKVEPLNTKDLYEEAYRKYSSFQINKVSLNIIRNLSITFSNKNHTNFQVYFTDLDSTLPNKFAGEKLAITYFTDNRDGVILSKDKMNEMNISFSKQDCTLNVRGDKGQNSYTIPVIGFYECNSIYIKDRAYIPFYYFDTINSEIDFGKISFANVSISFQNDIDKNMNNDLKKIDSSITTKQSLIEFDMMNYKEIFMYINTMVMLFFITMIFSSILLMFERVKSEKKNFFINYAYNKKRSKVILEGIYKEANTLLSVIIICLLIVLAISLIFLKMDAFLSVLKDIMVYCLVYFLIDLVIFTLMEYVAYIFCKYRV